MKLFKRRKKESYENFLTMFDEYLIIRKEIKNIQTTDQIRSIKNMIDNYNKKYGQPAHDSANQLRGFIDGVITIKFKI